MWKVMATLSLAWATLALPAHALEPDRTVTGSSVYSTHDPKLRIDLPSPARYLGADRWILGGYDDCEMHLFAETDAKQQTGRLYWVQFEAYVPEKPDLHHNYSGSRQIKIAGLDFYLDTWVDDSHAPVTPDSDDAHMRELLSSKGVHLADGMIYVRLVHLPDAEKRHEVMVIYGENIAPTGFTAAQLGKRGAERSRWSSIEQGLIQRALAQVKVTP